MRTTFDAPKNEQLSQQRINIQKLVQRRVDSFVKITTAWPVREDYKDESPRKRNGAKLYGTAIYERLDRFLTFSMINEGKMLPEVCDHLKSHSLLQRFKTMVRNRLSVEGHSDDFSDKLGRLRDRLVGFH